MIQTVVIKVLRKSFMVVLSLWMVVLGTATAVAQAQNTGIDFEAPIIEHEKIESGLRGENQIFTATVVDNDVVAGVTLFYRFAGDTEFVQQPMQLLGSTSLYTASVETEGVTANEIEYYIQAEDSSENVVLKGFAFDPLIRMIDEGSGAQETVAVSPDTYVEPIPKKKFNILYIALGVLALGAIAAAAGGGGGGSDDDDGGGTVNPPGTCTSCEVTITVSPF